jgi:energy-coupling factor transport system permease protein
MYHIFTWITWMAVVVVALSSTRNPLYLVLILLILLIQNVLLAGLPEAHTETSLHRTGAPFSPVRLLLLILATSTVFSGLMSHFGNTIILSIPGKIPLLSGALTVESLVYGFTNGLVLSGLLIIFTTLNEVLPMRSLVRLAPQAFYPIAMMVSIAITFLPATRRQLEQVIEAQAIRGHRMRGIRDWNPLAMPLLIGGLEKSMQLAETMTSRGFASREKPAASSIFSRLGMLGGLILILAGGVIELASNVCFLEIPLISLGGLSIAGVLWLEGRQRPRTTYKQERWRLQDGLVILGAILSLAFFTLKFPRVDHQVLIFNPYPQVAFPGFDPWIGVATLGLLFPGIFSFFRKT